MADGCCHTGYDCRCYYAVLCCGMAIPAYLSFEAITMISVLPYLSPALVLYLGAFILSVAPKRLASAIWLCTPIVALIVVLFTTQPHPAFVVLGFALLPQQRDSLSHAFGVVLTVMLIMGVIYAAHQKSTSERAAVFLYAGSALGIIFADDWISLFFFWEIMAVASSVIIWSATSTGSLQAGFRYLLFHLMGGVLLLAGVAGEFATTGQIQITHLNLESPSSWLILLGVLVNVGAFPLGAWLPDAYPQASWSGSVFLSMITTKVGIYLLLRNFSGTELLIWIGLVTAIHGLLYASFQIDFRRFLSYMLLSQLGIMICGIGLGTEMAQQGVIAHALSSMIYMTILFMVAGNIIKDIQGGGESSLSWILLTAAMLSGAALAALPVTLGFISKSIILDAAAESNFIVWAILSGISLGTGVAVCAMFNFLWKMGDSFKKDSHGILSIIRQSAMILPAVTILAGGVVPSFFYRLWTETFAYNAYTAAHLIQQGIIFIAAVLIFYLVRKLFTRSPKHPPADIDYLWRHLGANIVRWAIEKSDRVAAKVKMRLRDAGKATLINLAHWYDREGVVRYGWSTSILGMWALTVLGIYLIIYLIPGD